MACQRLWTLFVSAAFFLHRGVECDNSNDELSFRIAAYLPDYRFYINVNATTPFLDDLILFSVAPSPHSEGITLSSCCLHKDQYEIARKARAYKREQTGDPLKLWLTVGGGGRSNHFFDDPHGLTVAVRDLAIAQELDGVDLDCEYIMSQEEYHQYMHWIRQAAPILKKAGLGVSVALHAGQLMHPNVYQSVDRVHLTTYDMSGSYHAAMDTIRAAVDQLIQSGCPAQKILLGLPAYARHNQNPGDVKSYAELLDEMGAGEQIDTVGEWNGFQFDSPRSIRDKVAYAKSKNLGGVFLWEIGQDKQHAMAKGGMLLEAASGKVYGEQSREEL